MMGRWSSTWHEIPLAKNGFLKTYPTFKIKVDHIGILRKVSDSLYMSP